MGVLASAMICPRRVARYGLLSAVFMASVLLVATAAVETQPRGRPNIIYIMTDDHAAHAIGAYGSRVNKTPHLDRIAREGVRLNNVFATNSICTPSRAT